MEMLPPESNNLIPPKENVVDAAELFTRRALGEARGGGDLTSTSPIDPTLVPPDIDPVALAAFFDDKHATDARVRAERDRLAPPSSKNVIQLFPPRPKTPDDAS